MEIFRRTLQRIRNSIKKRETVDSTEKRSRHAELRSNLEDQVESLMAELNETPEFQELIQTKVISIEKQEAAKSSRTDQLICRYLQLLKSNNPKLFDSVHIEAKKMQKQRKSLTKVGAPTAVESISSTTSILARLGLLAGAFIDKSKNDPSEPKKKA